MMGCSINIFQIHKLDNYIFFYAPSQQTMSSIFGDLKKP